MNYLLNQHPVAIIHQIVSNYDKDEGPDPRAKIVLSTNSGTMWTGVPIGVVENQQQKSISMIVNETGFLSLMVSEINGIFVENILGLQSFLEEPWKTLERYGAISKMQLIRELKSESVDFLFELSFSPDTFPEGSEKLYGACLAWVVKFKKIVNQLHQSSPEAFKEIKSVQIRYRKDAFQIQKEAQSLVASLQFSADNFKKETISESLNRIL